MKKVFTCFLVVLLAAATICPEASAVTIVNPAAPAPVPAPAQVNAALDEFKNLSGKEKKGRIKEVKKAVKEWKVQKKAGKEPLASTVIQVIFAILLPPLGVYLHEGEINNKFWIDLILTLLFYLPGMIYALIVVLGDE